MTILCLTGWQQKPDALNIIAPDAIHLEYDLYNNTEELFKNLPKNIDTAIGWSLGGQLLVRAVAGGYITTKKLILLAAPFELGMSEAEFKEFRDNYIKYPKETVYQFNSLVGLGNPKSPRIIRTLNEEMKLWNNGLFWLDELGGFSCNKLDFSKFPATKIIHGECDKVINVANAHKFMEKLPDSELILIPNCGHTPHLSNDTHAV